MFVREKRIGRYRYIYLVESVREDGKTKQRILKNLGRKEVVEARGDLDRLARSAARLARRSMVLSLVEARGQVGRPPPAVHRQSDFKARLGPIVTAAQSRRPARLFVTKGGYSIFERKQPVIGHKARLLNCSLGSNVSDCATADRAQIS